MAVKLTTILFAVVLALTFLAIAYVGYEASQFTAQFLLP